MFQRYIKTIQQFAQLKNEERRSILRQLTDEQYNDVLKVLGEMPYIDFQVRSEGIYNSVRNIFIISQYPRKFGK